MKKTILFTDAVKWNGTKKTGISVRDGVIEYLGEELGIEPVDKIFTVFRSPATIAKAAPLMVNLPLIEDHIDPDLDPDFDAIGGSVTSSEVVDHFADETNSRLAIKNHIDVTDRFIDVLEAGKRELSLGYKAELIEHDVYDFEQRDIIPRHLAAVPAGRCGSVCSFIDGKEVLMKHKKKQLLKSFCDESGQPNMEQIVEIAQALPDALKELSIDKLKEVLPTLQNIVADSGVKPVVDTAVDEGQKATDEADADKQKAVDAEAEKKTFEDAVSKVLQQYGEVVEKARNFVDADYNFAGKTANAIMRDALATQYGEQSFTDAELPIAFKMLRQQATTNPKLTNFGDAATNAPQSLSDRIKADLEG